MGRKHTWDVGVEFGSKTGVNLLHLVEAPSVLEKPIEVSCPLFLDDLDGVFQLLHGVGHRSRCGGFTGSRL